MCTDMNNTSSISLPLYEKISRKNKVKNLLNVVILLLLISIPIHRVVCVDRRDFVWVLGLACEVWFTFYWLLILNIKWNPVEYKTYPDRLMQRVLDGDEEIPSVDMFVTTADAELEPPIITVNTVLSLLAVDYPPNKLACYVSDDGCSPIILYSLIQAYKFAKPWVSFCKKYDVQVRAPFRYFKDDSNNTNHLRHSNDHDLEFQKEWKNMKDEYEQLSQNIEAAVEKFIPHHHHHDIISGDCFEAFLNVETKTHPTIIKVIGKKKEVGGLPSLVYISREKRAGIPHHFKAGAMNALARVSGVMTNAPLMLNVDCDMFVNNPKVVHHALCLLSQPHVAFAQFPQVFYDAPQDDPFGNLMIVLYKYIGRGVAGLQGVFYGGTGCFHRRNVICGHDPPVVDNNIEEVVNCEYEKGTTWGIQTGWIYGSTTEDILTGLAIHKRGWKSAFGSPDPPAFLGCAPTSGPASMTQQKRWATGLLEILLSKNSPLYSPEKLHWRQCLAYIWILCWGLRSVPEHIYALLVAHSIITNSHFLPQRNEEHYTGFFYAAIGFFVVFNGYNICEYWGTGQSVRAWWNNQKMGRLNTMGAWFLGVLSVILKLLGVSEIVFEVTRKEAEASDPGQFGFDESPIFVVMTAVLLVQLAALSTLLFGGDSGILEAICSAWLVLCLWPILKGLFRKGKYGIPRSTLCKSISIALLFVMFCLAQQR